MAFLEIKGAYRKSNFDKDFDVYVNLGSGNGGALEHSVNGNQQLYSLYFSIGVATLFNKKNSNIDVFVWVHSKLCSIKCLPKWLYGAFMGLAPFFKS